jgi:ribosomal protein S12 methylthiotransferase accessory factor YcaO
MWLNQMTLPRIQLDGPRNQSNTLDRLIKKCERYRLQVHAVRLLTDAPTHAVCVVVEDSTNLAIRFTLGLKAHRSLSHAIEKALLEALRARTVSRIFSDSTHKNGPSSPSKGRLERVAYWSNIEHSGALSFIIAGSEEDSGTSTWDFDNEEQHLGRIVDWCRQSSYECAAVSLGRSAQNPTNLHVEMVIIPELQPTHQSESKPHLGGTRLQKIPIQFGYSPRKNPFIERPHPFF